MTMQHYSPSPSFPLPGGEGGGPKRATARPPLPSGEGMGVRATRSRHAQSLQALQNPINLFRREIFVIGLTDLEHGRAATGGQAFHFL